MQLHIIYFTDKEKKNMAERKRGFQSRQKTIKKSEFNKRGMSGEEKRHRYKVKGK